MHVRISKSKQSEWVIFNLFEFVYLICLFITPCDKEFAIKTGVGT